MSSALCVIPARYSSTRLPGKPLLKLGNKPVIMWVYDAAIKSNVFNSVIVATDDERIKKTVEEYGGKAQMTSKEHRTGSDRVWEVAENLNFDIIVNLQGDEPFIKPVILQKLIYALQDTPTADIATPVRKAKNAEEINSPSTAKVIVDNNGFALYFSRSPIPFPRDKRLNPENYLIHIGIYAYRKKALEAFIKQTSPQIEKTESLEQLRALYHGLRIKIVPVEYFGVSIDTPEDYRRAKAMLGGE